MSVARCVVNVAGRVLVERGQDRRLMAHHRSARPGDRRTAGPAQGGRRDAAGRAGVGDGRRRPRVPDSAGHPVGSLQRPRRADPHLRRGRHRPHHARTSCDTAARAILNDRGVPLELIADLLGHVDTTMLARTYRHRLRPSADAAVEVMELCSATVCGSDLRLLRQRRATLGIPPTVIVPDTDEVTSSILLAPPQEHLVGGVVLCRRAVAAASG